MTEYRVSQATSTHPNGWLMALILAVSTAGISPSVYADGGHWYAAFDLGQSHYNDGDLAVAANPCLPRCPGSSSIKSDDIGYRFVGGYRITDHWSVEAGYVELGQATDDFTYPVSSSPTIFVTNKDQFRASGLTMSAAGSYPFSNAWSVTGRFGIILANTSADHNNGQFVALSFSKTSSGLKTTIGGSLNWSLTQTVAARLSFDSYLDLDSPTAGKSLNVYLTTVGLVFSFR